MLNEVEEVFVGHGALSDYIDGLGIGRSLVVDA